MGLTLVRHCPFPELGTCHGTCFSPNSEPDEPRFSPVLSPNPEPARVLSSEKGISLSPNSKPAKPGFGRSFSELQTLPGFGVRRKWNWPSSKPVEPGFALVLSLQSEPVKVRRKEQAFFSNSEPVKPRLYPVLSPNYEPAESGLTGSYSELTLQTPCKNTILDHLDGFEV